MRTGRHPLILASLAVLTATGCAARSSGSDAVFSTIAADALGATVIEGKALVPSTLISNNSAGIISNGASGIIANNGGGIIAGNSSRYGLLGLAVAPLANALAYLTDPSEQFYKVNGKMVTTVTNKDGKYRFSQGVPKKKPVVVNVILSENRRVVGFTVPGAGSNELDISISTTYVTEFLRQIALEAGKTMADFDLKQLPGLATLTTTAIEADHLAIPDLNIGKIKDMDNRYALVVGQNKDGLGDAWAKLVGFRTIAGTTLAGSGATDSGGDGKPATEGEFYRLKGVCQDKAGNTYIADEGNHRIRKIDAKTGLLSTLAGNGNRGYANGPADKAMFNFPRSVAIGPDGNLYVFDSQNARVRKVDLVTKEVTTFAGDGAKDLGNLKFDNGFAGDGGPAIDAKLFSVRGGAFDSAGNLYIVDGLKGTNFHTIRKVDAKTGIISTFAGVPNTAGGFSGDGGPAAQAKLNYHNQIWITPDDQMYIADTFNDCIRKIDIKSGIITTVAGVPGARAESPEADGKLATQAKLNQPYGVAVDKKGQLFISERGFHRVWAVKTDGRLYAIAGGGTFTGEGDAKQLSFSEPHDLWVEADGNLLMAESRGSKLRRLYTKFGI
jgi:sugar lactone lactonase YvrE